MASNAATVSCAGTEAFRTPFVSGEVQRHESERTDSLERRLTCDPDVHVVNADVLSRLILREPGRDDGNDSIRIRERQALEQAAVDDAEHGRAEPDAEAERQHGDERKRRILGQHPNSGADVGENSFHT